MKKKILKMFLLLCVITLSVQAWGVAETSGFISRDRALTRKTISMNSSFVWIGTSRWAAMSWEGVATRIVEGDVTGPTSTANWQWDQPRVFRTPGNWARETLTWYPNKDLILAFTRELWAGSPRQTTYAFVHGGSEVVWTSELQWVGFDPRVVERFSCDGVVLLSEVKFPTTTNPESVHEQMFILAEGRVTAPIVASSPDLRVELGSAVNWIEGIRATWGTSTENEILPMGTITPKTLVGGTDPQLSSAGSVYDRVGRTEHEYEIRDDHSLSALYPFDNTVTRTTRDITVFAKAAPSLVTQYATNATAVLVGEVYDPLLPLPCGGEIGWTNQPLDITLYPGSIVGTFDTVLTFPDSITIVPNANASRSKYHIESSNTSGTPISGVLTEVGNASNLLSGTANGFLKIDKTNPIPAATHLGGYNFTDDSTDALSGLSITRATEIVFSAPSGPQPAPGDFHTFDSIPIMPDGTYDVWVKATDKAGNTATERVLSDILLLNGTVEMTKDTDQGATLHIVACPDADSISVTSCTPECSVGANVEVEEKSPLTYKLTLTNTDLSDTASGTFEDYLPEGTIVSTPIYGFISLLLQNF